MKHFVPSRDGLNVASFDAGYFFFPPLLSPIPWFLFYFFPFFSGGGGSCRRQGKAAAPLVGPGVGCSLGPVRVENA